MKKKIYSGPLAMLLMLAIVMTSSGCLVQTCTDCNTPPPCTYGPNGVPGPAFFGLDWTGCCPPTYVWTNNACIPPTFQYAMYYNSLPGNYHLYYEGRFLNGCCYTEYYWDVDFVVWVNAGTAGGCGFAGANGLPSNLMLICGPNGPGEVRTNKLADQGITTTVISQTDDEAIIQYVKGDINVRVTYTRSETSKKGLLDASGVKVALPTEK